MPKHDVRSALPAGTIPLLGELLSTALLVLLGCMSCVQLDGKPEPTLMLIVLTFGCVVMFNIQVFGHVSGAHMNPAVTTAAVLMRVTPPLLGAGYVAAQCAGAVVGFGLLTLFVPETTSSNAADGFCNTTLHPDISAFQGLMVEVAITTVLILVNCAFWDPVNHGKTDGLAIKFGLTIVGLSLAGGPFTGASMNPARSLGPAVWNNVWKHHWVYWVGPLFSGVLGPLMYKVLFQSGVQPAGAENAVAEAEAEAAEAVPLSVREKSAGGAA